MARVALVTGGTRGIGKAIVQRLKEDGMLVAAGYSGNVEAAEATAKELGVMVVKACARFCIRPRFASTVRCRMASRSRPICVVTTLDKTGPAPEVPPARAVLVNPPPVRSVLLVT